MPDRFKDVIWLDGTAGSINLNLCKNWPARGSAPLSARLYLTPDRRWVLDPGGPLLELAPEPAGDLLINWGWKLPPELFSLWQEAKTSASPPPERLPLPPVVLGKPTEAPIVRGKPKERLSEAQYNVIHALLEALET